MKGDSSFFIKGIYLILVIVVITFIINRIVALNVANGEEKQALRFNDRASDIVETLTGSKECLAYEEKGSVQSTQIKLSTHRVLDKKKLDDFKNRFKDMKPDCLQESQYGYKVQVSTFPLQAQTVNMPPKTSETINVKIDAENWEFGDSAFSRDDSLDKTITMTVPAMIYYDSSKLIPGIMKITVVSGDLEKFVGFIDQSCSNDGRSSISLALHYPVTVEKTDGKNYLCMQFDSGKACQRLTCNKMIDFAGISSIGNYLINSVTEGNLIKINV